MPQTEARGPGLSRRDFLKRTRDVSVGAAAFAVLTGCGIKPESRVVTQEDLKNLREQHARMETEIGNLDRLMGNLREAAVAVLGRNTDAFDPRLLQPFETHRVNKETNPDRNFYTKAIKNAELFLNSNSKDKPEEPSSIPAHYTYHFFEGEKDNFTASRYEINTRSLGVGKLDPNNLLDGLNFYHETDHARQDSLWITRTNEDPAAHEARKEILDSPGVILEMEIDAHLRGLNMLNVLTNGKYMEAVRAKNVRFSDFQKTLRARDDQAKNFEAEAERLALVADIENDTFINSRAFAQAIALGYRTISGRVYGQREIQGAPDFLAA